MWFTFNMKWFNRELKWQGSFKVLMCLEMVFRIKLIWLESSILWLCWIVEVLLRKVLINKQSSSKLLSSHSCFWNSGGHFSMPLLDLSTLLCSKDLLPANLPVKELWTMIYTAVQKSPLTCTGACTGCEVSTHQTTYGLKRKIKKRKAKAHRTTHFTLSNLSILSSSKSPKFVKFYLSQMADICFIVKCCAQTLKIHSITDMLQNLFLKKNHI